MTVEVAAPVDDGRCIGCGPHSRIGLKMTFDVNDDRSVESRVRLSADFQGWRDVVHGGMVALLLDEAMAYAAGAHGILGVTAELKMRFRKPVEVGKLLVVRGNVLWQRRGVLGIDASVHAADGTLLASGAGSFMKRGEVPPGTLFAESRLRGGT
jgi:uncharacterized protein (TIGR00369 family)